MVGPAPLSDFRRLVFVKRRFGILPRRAPIRAAYGSVQVGSRPATPDALVKRSEGWQRKILHLHSAVPESSGASALVEHSMNRIDFRVEAEDEDGARVAELIQQSMTDIDYGRAGKLLWLVGEFYPSWSADDTEVVWDILSPTEIEVKKGSIPKFRNIEDKMIPDPDRKWFRAWQQDSENRYKAWSPHKSMVDLLEAMYVHQLADTAVATSRLAGAGILFWPTDLPSIPVADGGMPEPGTQEELQMRLQEAMSDSINDRSSSDAFIPLVVFGDTSVDGDQKPQHILLERPDDAAGYAERFDGYAARYARGVELPVESVTGIGPANHWTAWVVKEDKWRFYLKPLADVIAKAFERNYVVPLARAMGYEGKISLVPDGSELVGKPDKSDKAIRLAQLGGYLTQEEVREATGFESDVPDGQEVVEVESKTRLSELPVEFRDTSPM